MQTAERLMRLRQRMNPLLGLRDVMLDGDGGAFARGVDRIRDLPRAFDVHIGDGDARAFFRQHPRRRFA